jgi:hypothetical protein
MGGPFVSDEMFDIVVKYVEKKLKSGHMGVVVIKDAETELRHKGLVKEIHTQWTQPDWTVSNDMIRAATRFDPEAGTRMIDWPLYRSLLLERCMKSWDVADEQGKPVPCVKEKIGKLDPNIGAALVDDFLAKTTPTEKDLGE